MIVCRYRCHCGHKWQLTQHKPTLFIKGASSFKCTCERCGTKVTPHQTEETKRDLI